MFTGIIEEVGTLRSISDLGDGRELRIVASRVLDGLKLGDSVSIDGACHTITERFDDGFMVQSVATTLQRTTLGEFAAGRSVNLERAMALGERLGGHLVQGHVDGTGAVLRVERRGELTLIDFTMTPPIAGVTILHGSITLNGISLTVNALPEPGICQVSIIPFTWTHTTMHLLSSGDRVNLEGDTIGKYVRHMLGEPGTAGTESTDLRRLWGY
ncbi:riboflavin synthase [soil metagenome]